MNSLSIDQRLRPRPEPGRRWSRRSV